MRVILANQNRGNILNLMNNNICIIALSLWNIEENFLLREIAYLYPFCSTHFCFMVISCFTCINYLNMCSIIKKAKRTFALDIMLQTNLHDFWKSYFFPQPGDWPSQLYTRQTVYETLPKFYHKHCTKTFTSTTDHYYHLASCTTHSSCVPVNHNSSPPSILSLIPCIGPLHVSLNRRKMLFNDFSLFPQTIMNNLSQNVNWAKILSLGG